MGPTYSHVVPGMQADAEAAVDALSHRSKTASSVRYVGATMEGAYRIEFQEWYQPSGLRDVRRRAPGFRVHADGVGGAGLFVGVLLSGTAAVILTRLLDVGHEDAPEIEDFLLTHGVQTISQRLREGTWQVTEHSAPQEVLVQAEDLEGLLAAYRSKHCDYQVADGRDLYCAAASRNDETVVGSLGVRMVAPTSRSTCAACNMPDARVVCSHLHHPQVQGMLLSASPLTRDVMWALCDLGREEVGQPARCRTGGNECWERVLEPPAPAEVARMHPRALLEALDYLDTTWRLAFDGRPLLAVRSAAGISDVSQPCTGLDEFKSRMSTVSELLRSLAIPDELLTEGEQVQADHTLARLRSCLRRHLDAEEYDRVDQALAPLTAATRVRVALQHEAAAGELPGALARLGVVYPPPYWGDAWEEVRSRLAATVREVAEVVRGLAIAE
jgi:hypothetical protein